MMSKWTCICGMPQSDISVPNPDGYVLFNNSQWMDDCLKNPEVVTECQHCGALTRHHKDNTLTYYKLEVDDEKSYGKHLKFEVLRDMDYSKIMSECVELQLAHFRDENEKLPCGQCLIFKRMIMQPLEDNYWEMYWEAEKRSVVPGDYEWVE